jgi:predicted GIY-YIG superfamily endonuclease
MKNLEELEYEVAMWTEKNEREKLLEFEKPPDDYFNSIPEIFLDETALYRCFNNKDELLYIGISFSATTRNSQHAKRSGWASDVVVINIERLNTRQLALAAEEKAIKTEYPKYNKQHNYGERPRGLGSADVCSFQNRDNNGGFVIGGLRISNSLSNHDGSLVRYAINETKLNAKGNPLKIYNIFCFKPWEDQIIEMDLGTLMSIFGFKYKQEHVKHFTENVIDPAIMLMKKSLFFVEETFEAYNELEDTIKRNPHCSGKYLTYTIKKTEGNIIQIVFINNKEPTQQTTYLDVQADKLGIDIEDLRIYQKVKQILDSKK